MYTTNPNVCYWAPYRHFHFHPLVFPLSFVLETTIWLFRLVKKHFCSCRSEKNNRGNSECSKIQYSKSSHSSSFHLSALSNKSLMYIHIRTQKIPSQKELLLEKSSLQNWLSSRSFSTGGGIYFHIIFLFF